MQIKSAGDVVDDWCHGVLGSAEKSVCDYEDKDAIVDEIQDDCGQNLESKEIAVLESDDMEFDFGLEEVDIDLDISLNSHSNGRKLLKEKSLKRNKAVEFLLD